jgi:hypothetical protein
MRHSELLAEGELQAFHAVEWTVVERLRVTD